MALFPVALSDPYYPKTTQFSTFCIIYVISTCWV